MITNSPPVLREHLCSEREVAARLMEALKERRFSPAGVDPLKDALVQVFARYCELLTDRLNRIPETHHHAFVSMLGAQPAPAIPARVPLTFKPVKSSSGLTAVVPRYTQVSASAENESGLVVFETSKDLMLVQAEVISAMAVDEQRLVYADVAEMISPASATGFPHETFFADALPMTRALHIAAPAALDLSSLTRLQLKIDLEYAGGPSPDIEVEWGIQSKDGFQRIEPEFDTTDGLTRDGELEFGPPKDWPSRAIGTGTFPWLSCRLRPKNTVSASDNSMTYPVMIVRIELSAFTELAEIPLKGAFHGGIPLDISRDFYPLGERPRFGDVFYALSDSFAAEDTEIEIEIKLTNPTGATDSPIPIATSKGNPQLRWECHTTHGWVILDCVDGTQALTRDGKLVFTVPNDAAPTIINSVTSGCIRARIIGGAYVSVNHTDKNELIPQMAPPSIAEMKVTSSKKYGPARPECLIIESNFQYTTATSLPFAPFPLPEEHDKLIYLGLRTSDSKTSYAKLSGRTISFYAAARNHVRRIFVREKSRAAAAPRWQARGKAGWLECTVSDMTEGFNNSGIVEVDLPDSITSWDDSVLDRTLCWLRINWDGREAEEKLPCLRRLLLNTVMASQTMRLENELLGSSNGRPKQEFHSLHNPIIGKIILEIREQAGKPRNQPGAWHKEEPQYTLGSMKISSLPINEVWIPWSEVPDFLDSSSDSRHYIINRLTGRIQFGDGMHGLIPPIGANNIRLREYHTGGGKHGNQPVYSVTRLHTTVPYVESVTNPEPSLGGQDMEDINLLNRRAAAQLRHRDRAICMDDYADLALKASPEVGFAACVGARDISRESPREEVAAAGVVSVIIVPRDDSGVLCPEPSYELMRNVKTFLDSRRPIGVEIVVTGPEYVVVRIIAEISWRPDYSRVGAAAECEQRVANFLHPLTGGPDGHGWRFGQRPHASDIYPLLGGIEGVNHIRALEVESNEDRPGLLSARTFLICSGKHDIKIL